LGLRDLKETKVIQDRQDHREREGLKEYKDQQDLHEHPQSLKGKEIRQPYRQVNLESLLQAVIQVK
jgi:hypothetical protein